MIVPILVLDRLVPQKDYTMLWWAVLFSALLTAIDSIFDWIPVFREKLLLKRISFFVVLIVVLMGSSWIMGIITTLPVLLYGIIGCLIAAVRQRSTSHGQIRKMPINSTISSVSITKITMTISD